MAAITSFESNSVKELASIVQKVGIPLKSESDRNPRYEALAFIVRANDTSRTTKLIEEISQIAASATNDFKQAACDVSHRIHMEVSCLWNQEMEKIESSNNEEVKCGARAVHKLYLACKSDHQKKHAQGEIVNFAGVPHDLIFGIPP